MICLLISFFRSCQLMHLLMTDLASLFPPGMTAIRRTLAVMSRTVSLWSWAWASSLLRRASSSDA